MDWFPLFSKSLNTAMVAVLALGLYHRHRPKLHIPLMLTAFAVDLGNVIMIEFFARGRGKGAVEQGLESLSGEGSAILRFHIAVSLACIAGYFVAVITGTRLYRRGRGRLVHKANAAIFVLTRLASYVTSFWMGA
jgi:hypothetical protein